MGRSARNLLVIFIACVGAAAICWWQVGPAQAPKKTDKVQAEHYQDFWLWPGNSIPTNIPQINNLYILQGEFLGKGSQSNLRLTGILPSRITAKKIWLVFRVEQALWSDAITGAINHRIKMWEYQGNTVAGIQIDFDARSAALADYGNFLQLVRQKLPAHYQLSVTGLLDWSTGAYRSGLANISQTADEVIFQTYQGRSTIPDYLSYLQPISTLKQPFKIGLIEGGLWQPQLPQVKALHHNPHFLGFVVFLKNRS